MTNDKTFIGTKEDLVNTAWSIWLEHNAPGLEEDLKSVSPGQMFEAGWKVGYMLALTAYEVGGWKAVNNG